MAPLPPDNRNKLSGNKRIDGAEDWGWPGTYGERDLHLTVEWHTAS